MRRLLLYMVFGLTFVGLGAQNRVTKEIILSKTNVSELNRLSKIWFVRDSLARQDAIRKAQEMGWPIRKVVDQEIIELMSLDPNGNPVYYMTNNDDAAISTQTDQLHIGGSSGYGLEGDSMTIGEWDGGEVRTTHEQLSGRVTQVDAPSSRGVSNHATHVAGTLIGDGTPVSRAKGMAPQANLDAYDWNSDESEMASAAASGLLVSNHSYGFITGWRGDGWWGSLSDLEPTGFGYYGSSSREWDVIAYNAPFYLICKSAGNDRNDDPVSVGSTWYLFGDPSQPYIYDPVNDPSTSPERDGGTDRYDCIPWNGTAKNILTVGAVRDVLNYTGPGSVSMSSFSGWGPADDGRIKPDIVGNGVSLYSSLAGSNSNYGSYSGTSMSSPNVAGSLILLQEHYINTHNGDPMLSSTLKGLIIHTARECGPGDGPDYEYGWGLLSARDAADLIQEDINKDSTIAELTLNNGDTLFYTFESDGQQDLRATICWTDPPASTQSTINDPTPRLVNDLDLRITDDDGNTVYEPYILDPANPASAASTGDNDVDNMEQVYIASPPAGMYTLTVTHKGFLASPQEVSMIVSGQTNVVLPVEFTEVKAVKDLNCNKIECSVYQQNVDHYVLERWEEGRFVPVSQIPAIWNDGLHQYTFYDYDIKIQNEFLYRIKSIDRDGSYEFSPMVRLERVVDQDMLRVYPNPVGNYINLEGDMDIKQVRLFTESGKSLNVWHHPPNRLNLSYLPSGKYYLVADTDQGSISKEIVKIE